MSMNAKCFFCEQDWTEERPLDARDGSFNKCHQSCLDEVESSLVIDMTEAEESAMMTLLDFIEKPERRAMESMEETDQEFLEEYWALNSSADDYYQQVVALCDGYDCPGGTLWESIILLRAAFERYPSGPVLLTSKDRRAVDELLEFMETYDEDDITENIRLVRDAVSRGKPLGS